MAIERKTDGSIIVDKTILVNPGEGSGRKTVRVEAISTNLGRDDRDFDITVNGAEEHIPLHIKQKGSQEFISPRNNSVSFAGTKITTAVSGTANTKNVNIYVDTEKIPTWRELMSGLMILAGPGGTTPFQLKEGTATSSGTPLRITTREGELCLGDIKKPINLDTAVTSLSLGKWQIGSLSEQGVGTLTSIKYTYTDARTGSIKTKDVAIENTLPLAYNYATAATQLPEIILRFGPWVKFNTFTADTITKNIAKDMLVGEFLDSNISLVPADATKKDPGATRSFEWGATLDVEVNPFENKTREVTIMLTGEGLSAEKSITLIQGAGGPNLSVDTGTDNRQIILSASSGSSAEFQIISNTSWEIS